MYHTILFDLDGTLTDSGPGITNSVAYALKKWNIEEKDINVLSRKMSEVMTKNPSYVKSEDLAAQVLKLVEDRHINDIIVVDDDLKVVGLIDVQDLPGLKLL